MTGPSQHCLHVAVCISRMQNSAGWWSHIKGASNDLPVPMLLQSPEDHYAILCNCYGSAALQALNITRAAVVDFLLYRSGPLAEAALSQGIKRLYIQHYRLAYGLARTR
jgi:hypothetical protein